MTTVDPAPSLEERVAAGSSAGACCNPCAEFSAPARGGEMPDIAAAMASCRRMFEGACRKPTESTHTSEPSTATDAADSSEKEVRP